MREDRFGGELGDWAGKRRRLEERYAIETWSCYGTADFGLIGFERRGEIGYRIHGDCYVQICDPGTGHPLPPGESGEIVVTTLARGWPMIRFGTGDVSVALELLEDGGISWIAPLQGRVGAAVKVREIFIYPAHAERLVREIDGIARTAFTVSRNANRDEITGLVALAPGTSAVQVEDKLRQAFSSITRLKLDQIKYVGADEIGDKPIVDQRN
jgi:phenylacetate-CoA ligase